MDLKSKKGMTLVEMIVSIGLIALIAMALLGILLPTIALEKNSRKTNVETYEISGELSRALFDVQNDDSLANTDFVSKKQHTLKYKLNGYDYSCDGTLLTSTKKPGEQLEMYAFTPTPNAGG